MSAIGVQSQINKDRALWLSTIPTDVIHGNIICDTILANAGYISTLYSDNLNVSSLNASTLSLTTSDVSGMFVSSLRGNTAFFSSLTLASDLSGGVGFVRFAVDASGIQVDGDPIRFDNLVYLTSTINIVQVSTIVDTFITASNGYFSTISTGVLSSGVASIRDANISSLFVSSLTALDLSGDFAENWSQYPTQNSSIIFQPAYVLSNVSNKLYFAGQELTDASGGGQDWSVFPAVQDVSMNNFSLRGLSTLQYQDGARLYSQTGNNLFYNGQPVQYGAVSNVSQWANYPAVNTIQTGGFPISSLGNINLVANSNVRILADSISSVADQGLLAPASYADINLTAQNGLKGRINLTANPGVAGIFGEVNITANGGTTGSVGTGGLITLNANTPLGFSNLTSAVKISGAGVNSYAGLIPPVGSLAGYNFIYGTTGVNICAGLPPAFPNIPFTTYLYGTAGVTTSSDFYCPNIYPYWNGLTTPPDLNITGRYIVPNLAQVYVNLSNVKNIYMDSTAQIQNAQLVSTISTIGQSANFGTGMFTTLGAGTGVFVNNNVQTLNANTLSTSFVQAPLLSTININLSTINGVDWQDISGGVFTTISSFNTAQASTFHVSTLAGFNNFGAFSGSTINVETALQFVGQAGVNPGSGRWISSLREINNLGQDFEIFVSTTSISYAGGVNPNGYIRLGGGGAFDTYVRNIGLEPGVSTLTLQAVSSVAQEITTSSIGAYGGLPIIAKNLIRFASLNGIDNVDAINLNPPSIPQMTIGASTIFVDAVNTRIPSLSSLALQFSTASCFNSNGTFNTALNIVQDTAGSATGGVQISVEGRSLTTGAVRHVLNMGYRASDGANYIQAVWPGQNLEDLAIEGEPVKITDGGLSTIFNQNPFALQTTQPVGIGAGSGLITLSTNQINIAPNTNLTGNSISTQSLFVSSINATNAIPSYGQFLTLSTMTLAQSNTTLLHFSTNSVSSNLTMGDYGISFSQNGIYKCGVSFQFVNTSGVDEVEYFFQKNSNTLSYSGTIHSVQNNTESTAYTEILQYFSTGESLQIGLYTNSADVVLSTINGNVTISPGAITTINRVDCV